MREGCSGGGGYTLWTRGDLSIPKYMVSRMLFRRCLETTSIQPYPSKHKASRLCEGFSSLGDSSRIGEGKEIGCCKICTYPEYAKSALQEESSMSLDKYYVLQGLSLVGSE